jgi:hypothetical protein
MNSNDHEEVTQFVDPDGFGAIAEDSENGKESEGELDGNLRLAEHEAEGEGDEIEHHISEDVVGSSMASGVDSKDQKQCKKEVDGQSAAKANEFFRIQKLCVEIECFTHLVVSSGSGFCDHTSSCLPWAEQGSPQGSIY